MTLDIAIELLKGLVLRPDGSSALQDDHFAEMEGVREESTLLLRNFYKVGASLGPRSMGRVRPLFAAALHGIA